MKDKLNSGMVKISHWFRMNKLSLNFEKSKFMIIGSSRNLNNLTFISIEIQGPDIKHADHFKYLGATISSTLTCLILLVILNFFKDQPTSSLLTRIKHLLPRHAQLHFYNSLVIPIFDYADIIWGDKNNTVLMENLQVLRLLRSSSTGPCTLQHLTLAAALVGWTSPNGDVSIADYLFIKVSMASDHIK